MFNRNLAACYSLLAITILMISVPLWNVPILPESNTSRLFDLIISFDDPKMTVNDLAFYLKTHNFEATPMGTYVKLNLPDAVCQLFPNGEYPGLCNMTCKPSNLT
jgi:hypothetical protein